MKEYKNNEKNIVRRIDSKTQVDRKYKLIVEEVYQYESDSPDYIDKIIEDYVNYT